MSPRERAVLVRKLAGRTVRVEERKAHWLTRRLFDRACTCTVVEVRCGEPRTRGIDLNANRLKVKGEGERDRIEGRLRRAVSDAEHRTVRVLRVGVQRERAGAARYINDTSRRRLTKKWQHRLCDGDDAEHVRLEHPAPLVERCAARAARLCHVLKRFARLARMRDGGVVHQHVETAELVSN